MVKAITEKFHEMVIEVSDDGIAWERPGAFIDVTVQRTANIDQTEVPDFDDASLPLNVEQEVRSIEVSATGTGVWAQQSHGMINDWLYSAQTKQARIGHLNAAVGDTQYETGPALLVALGEEVSDGQVVRQSVELRFVGVPTRTPKAGP